MNRVHINSPGAGYNFENVSEAISKVFSYLTKIDISTAFNVNVKTFSIICVIPNMK